MNQTQLIGRLTKDPELKYSPSGVPVVRFTLAVNREMKRDEADFINCIAFNKVAESLANYQKKGSRIGVVGRIQTGSYENQQGQRVFTTDVIANSIEFLDTRSESTGGSQSTSNYKSSTNTGGANQNAPQGNNGGNNNQPSYLKVEDDPFANSKGPMEVSEDDLPF
ncbi:MULTISPECIES: single-stranded DNA-binding protein [unclassified Lysinibacillus]|uniref:single-stranded DNA-binding protein n=1 Tax=unclassified Lysinibacillus TaxID=2636778 RepID=UPI0038105710